MAPYSHLGDADGAPGLKVQDFSQIFQAILQSNENLIEQNRAILALLSSNFKDSTHKSLEKIEPDLSRPLAVNTTPTSRSNNDIIWNDILGTNHHESHDFMQTFHNWARPPSLAAVLNGKRAWTSWSYRASFPELSAFLKRATLSERCPCQVSIGDYHSFHDEPTEVSFTKASTRINDLWEQIKDRPVPVDFGNLSQDSPHARTVSARLFRIIDLSPVILACILGSTPQLDLSYMAAFFERHLKFSNWGRVSLLKFKDMSWSSYTFEYHFSFYYVTPDYVEADSVKSDRRKWRKSAPFGREMATKTRYIHEECLSFLLIGHFKDVTTCIQLAESYFKFDPYSRKMEPHSFRPYNLEQSPALMLLSWISVGLHHISWRWQIAIEAVDGEIKSSAQVVFMINRNDLMADDPQFSLSKTYFWALQAYKLFEKTLLETIDTWKAFKDHSLPKLRDGRIAPDDWRIRIEDIDDAIRQLESKVNRIRTRMSEVKDLRTGLISASALFDSRTSVRQGENIRILTYITILFFPLSFVTSIFGMQFMTDSSDALKAFAISLPAITFGAALLVFNLENIISTWTSVAEVTTSWLRRRMKDHRREDWKERAIALHEDLAASKPPVTRAKRQSTAWVYMLFLLEHVFLALPLHEALATLSLLGIVRRVHETASQKRDSAAIMSEEEELMDSATARRMLTRKRVEEKINQSLQEELEREKRKRDEERGIILTTLANCSFIILSAAKVVLTVSFGIVRALLFPVWATLLAIECSILAVFYTLESHRHSSPPADDPLSLLSKATAQPASESSWGRAWKALGLDMLSPPRKLAPDIEDAELQLRIRRVATRLGSIGTPILGLRRTDNRVQTRTGESHPPPTDGPEKGPASPTSAADERNLRTEYAEDMIKVSLSSNSVTRKVDRGWRFAQSGLNPELEVRDQQDLELDAAIHS